jgi:hypothetical protein
MFNLINKTSIGYWWTTKLNIKDQKEKRYIIDKIGLYSARMDHSSDKILQMRCFLNSIARIKD